MKLPKSRRFETLITVASAGQYPLETFRYLQTPILHLSGDLQQ